MPKADAMMHTEAEHRALMATRTARQQRRHIGREVRNEGTRMACPHCGASSEIRTSRVLSKTMRELIYACTNAECGHTFVALTEIVRTLSPSATPDPHVNLPLSSHVRRDMLRAVLDCAGSAPHQAAYSPPQSDLFEGGADTS